MKTKSLKFLDNLIQSEGKYFYIICDSLPGARISNKIQEVLKSEKYYYIYDNQEVSLTKSNPCIVRLTENLLHALQGILRYDESIPCQIIAETSDALDMDSVLKHLRSIIQIRDFKGQNFYFRFFDPDILKAFIPTLDNEQTDEFWGPISAIYVINQTKDDYLRFEKNIP